MHFEVLILSNAASISSMTSNDTFFFYFINTLHEYNYHFAEISPRIKTPPPSPTEVVPPGRLLLH